MGETRVDLQHLLEDLRDAYTGALEETILTEIVANALDSGATRIRLQPNPADVTLTVGDDGRIPSAIATLERRGAPASGGVDEREGIAISTFGKIIKSGWDWLGLTPVTPSRVSGLIEAPDLAGCLTLSKNDFIRTGPRGATYLAYRKAIQEVVSRQLAAWGDARDTEARPRTIRLERDLERVLEDLADDFPLLRSLVNQRAGGQKRLPLPGRGPEEVPGPLFANMPSDQESNGDDREGAAPAEAEITPGEEQPPGESQSPSTPAGEQEPAPEPPHVDPGASPDSPVDVPTSVGTFATVPGRKRLARYGLLLQFESRPDDSELGRPVDSTIWINEAHPAYARATASRSAGYHIALTVALALAPLGVVAKDEHAFITQFLAHWGGSETKRPRRGKR